MWKARVKKAQVKLDSYYIEEWTHMSNNRTGTTHAVTEEISQLKIVGQTQCGKRAAEEDSHTLRQIFDDTSDNVV